MILERTLSACLALAASMSSIAPARAQAEEVDDLQSFIRENYDKSIHQIPMRDGVKLHTIIYSPKDGSAEYPIMLFRTPYSIGPYEEGEYRTSLGPSELFARDGYIFVYQDVRGCYMSEGDFINMTPHVDAIEKGEGVDESSDTFDTIEYLLESLPNDNGRVGMWGISYPGFYAAASMCDAHPALKAVSPQAPIADWWYDDFHHHGAFFLPHGFRFLSSFGQPRPEPTTERPGRDFEFWTEDGYLFYLDMGPLKNANEKYLKGRIEFWNDIIEHPNYDEFWQAMNILPHLENVAPAVMTVGGWFDAEDLYGPLQIYRSIEAKNSDAFNMLVMGPWRHGGWSRTSGDSLGFVQFGSNTSEFYQNEIEFPFFQHFLKDAGEHTLPEAYVFETGTNEWNTFEHWPPRGVRQRYLYARENGRLGFQPPQSNRDNDFDEYISDPERPVPFTDAIAQGMTTAYMTDDQRFAARRPDVLVYQTDALEEDITLAGPIVADLWVSTSGTDSDWIVKVIDVFPPDYEDHEGTGERQDLGGYQMMVRSEVIRGRFRSDPSNPEPFTPNEPTHVFLPLQDVLHTFRAGHRIMVQIQSTWFPLVDRNPQTFVENIYLADEKDFVKATQRVYRSREYPTRIEIGELPNN
jgi:putative CocE/NonD family hydrolase